jgi:2,4-dienoyl-CoA reductase (NADPH2)
MSAYPHLFSPLRVGALDLPNRLVMGSMHTRLETLPDGPRRLAAFYAERARGGAALLITGGVAPNRDGLLEEDSEALERADQVPAHRVVTEAVHAAGGRICLQILHAGRYAKIAAPVGASEIPSPINRRTIRPLADHEVARTVDDFARCAALAREAGYDGVEIMGSEGYLVTQFTCPRTNTRTDRWGGPLENRLRFPLEIVRRMRARVGPGFLIVFRISALDWSRAG